MTMSIMYNGIQFSPVSTRQSIVVPHSAEVLWSVVGQFSKQALWMGTVEGQPIFTQLLGGETADYIGAVRVFGIADKLLFEQLTGLDNQEMAMSWQLMAHPMNSNPFPAAFVNCKGSLRVAPVSLPGNQAFIQWRIDLLTEHQHVAHMDKAINDIMAVGLTNLVKYMEKSVSVSSGDRSSASATLGGLVGSSVAPAALGVQYLPQPAAAQPHIQPMGQAVPAGTLSGDSTLLQQPQFVPAPGNSLGAASMSGAQPGHQQQRQFQPQQQQHNQFQQQHNQFQQQQLHTQFQQQQQQQYNQFQYQQQQQQQQQSNLYQQVSMTQQQLQQQLQQQAYQQTLNLGNSAGSTSSEQQRSMQRVTSMEPQRGLPGAQPQPAVGSDQGV